MMTELRDPGPRDYNAWHRQNLRPILFVSGVFGCGTRPPGAMMTFDGAAWRLSDPPRYQRPAFN